MKDGIVWKCKCIECERIYKLKDDNNVEIDKQVNVLETKETSGICPGCLEKALHPLIGLA